MTYATRGVTKKQAHAPLNRDLATQCLVHHTHTHTHTHARKHTHTHTHTPIDAYCHPPTHTRTDTHTHTDTGCRRHEIEHRANELWHNEEARQDWRLPATPQKPGSSRRRVGGYRGNHAYLSPVPCLFFFSPPLHLSLSFLSPLSLSLFLSLSLSLAPSLSLSLPLSPLSVSLSPLSLTHT